MVRREVPQPRRRSRFGIAAAIIAGTIGIGTVAYAGVSSAATSFVTPAGGGVVTQLALDNGGYTKCLNDFGQNVTAGARITLYTCGTNQIANQWVTYPDNTIRPYLNTGMALTVNGSNHTVLEPATGIPAQSWYYRDDGALVSGLTNAVGVSYMLNDPGYNTANGTQQIIWNEGNWQPITTNAHWWVTSARFGSSTLSNRPDSGGNGYWANDHLSRGAMVLYMGDKVPGTHTYQGSVSDTGTFHALAGAYQPNQGGANAGHKLGDSLGGSATGGTGYSFTSSNFVSKFPGSAYSGSNPTSTSLWYKLFFSGTTAFSGGIATSGPVQWSWQYISNADVCGNHETWTDAAFNNGGQDSGAGNITAPAACV